MLHFPAFDSLDCLELSAVLAPLLPVALQILRQYLRARRFVLARKKGDRGQVRRGEVRGGRKDFPTLLPGRLLGMFGSAVGCIAAKLTLWKPG